MQTVYHIIHAKWLITCEEQNKTLTDHALIIDQKKILAILPSDQVAKHYQATLVEHFTNHVIMPGLINTHTHIAMNYFRGLADDLPLMQWLNEYIWPAEKKWVSHDFVYDASLFAMAEMIHSGTTCFNDMYFFPEATAEATEVAGMRAHLGMTVINVPTAYATTTDDYFAKGLAFLNAYRQHELITPTFAPHAIYTVGDNELHRIKELAEEHNVKINMHVQETADEVALSMKATGLRPLQRLHDIGLLTPRLIAIHMTQIDQNDFALLAQHKPNLVHCPMSNMKLASGTCPVTELLKQNINVALGTDGAASNNDLDMFSEMRTAAFLAKLSTGNPESVNAATALTLATQNGAKALGIEKTTGSLTVGKSADLIAIQLDEFNTLPVYHPTSHLVYAVSRHQVTDVWVADKRLLKNRELTTLDKQAIKQKAIDWGKRIGLI